MTNPAYQSKAEIISGLSTAVEAFNSYVRQMSQQEFEKAPPGKWNAGQHLDHLVRSIKPLNLAYGLPGILLRWKFGLANRPSRSYQQLVEKYQIRLGEGGRAAGRFIPDIVSFEQRAGKIEEYEKIKDALCKKLQSFSEKKLDKYILPHPLVGKLTLREMVFFTIYHNYHHLRLVQKGQTA